MHLRQHGFTIIELLVGCTVALIVAAATMSVVAAQLNEVRLLLASTRLDRDLRSAADVVTRDLRRAGYWSDAASGVAAGTAPSPANPYGPASAGPGASDAVGLTYSRDLPSHAGVDDSEQFGFRLRGGVLQLQLGAANWQALTDTGSIVVTSFVLLPGLDEIALADFCERPCPPASISCPPRQQVRSFDLTLTARSVADPRLVHALQSSVRVRNDALVGACAS